MTKKIKSIVPFTQKAVDGLTMPAGAEDMIYWDQNFPGFGLRLRAGGSAKYILQYKIGTQQRRIGIGDRRKMRLEAAKKTAGELHAQVMLGQDPQGQKLEARDRAGELVEPLMQRFLEFTQPERKPRYHLEVVRHLLRHAKPLHGYAISAIDRRRIAELLTALRNDRSGKVANQTRIALSVFFGWAVKEGLIETSPVIGTNVSPENGARQRLLQPDELRRIWRALNGDQYGAINRLLVLTGARRDEIGALRWSEIDFTEKLVSLPGGRTKNGRPHLIPLSDPALAILKAQPHRIDADGNARDLIFGEGSGPFSGWSKCKERLDARIAEQGEPLPHWTPHDYRRLLSTTLHEELDVAPHIVETLLGHISGHKQGVAGTYNVAQYIEQRRRALADWANFVLDIVDNRKPPSKVLRMRRKT
jgi:integrase